MRGEVAFRSRDCVQYGITPACAGKRAVLGNIEWESGDHPRVCGEKPSTILAQKSHMGSPPRVRGEVQLLHDRVKQLRITPACAGRSNIISIDMSMNWDHPRVRGEKQTHIFSRIRSQGSPPRARGEANPYLFPYSITGITPACAGRSSSTGCAPEKSWDHPRVCGEKGSCNAMLLYIAGSPPRVRGEAHRQERRADRERITPACAGRSG